MNFKINIYNGNTTHDITNLCYNSIVFTSERKNNPSKLTFKIARDIPQGKTINFNEGDRVELFINDYPTFKGYIFTKSRNKEQIITVTAYDQLRYLKNKQFYYYENKKASEVVNMIAEDFKLKIGEIDDTEYVINYRREDLQTLFDTILNAVDLTVVNTQKLFTLYDEFGKLMLKEIHSLRLPLMIVSEDISIIDFNYKTDIDDDTYNKIKLYKNDHKNGRKDIYVSEDSLNQSKWGVLQYYESVPDNFNSAQIKDTANKILKQKNRIKKELSVEFLAMGFGEEKIRGGSGIFVKIDNLGDCKANSWFIVNKVTHILKNNEHTLKIDIEEDIW